MKKQLAFILIALLIVSLAAGCNNPAPAASGKPEVSETPVASTAPTASEGPKAVADGGEISLPISSEKATFTAWNSYDASSSGITSNNDSTAYQELEKRTNIHIEWFHPASNQSAENFNLSIASGDYYDTYMCALGNMIGGPDAFIDNGIFIDIMPYLQEFAPNYEYVRNLDEVTLPTTITDKGRAIGFYQIAKTLQWPFLGPLGRLDWLKELNLALPETYDEMHTVLEAFRDQKNAKYPLSISSAGLDGWLMAGFDTMYGSGINFIQVDGNVRFGATEPGFKEYITLLNQWYAEGLVDPEFYTRATLFDSPASNVANILGGEVGVGRSLYTYPDYITMMAGDQEIEWGGFYQLAKAKGDKFKVAMEFTAINLNKSLLGTISTQCEDIETLMRWYDYLYTEEGSLLGNYGLEGEGFNYIDGTPKVSELIYADKDGRALNTMLPLYTMYQTQPM